MRARYLYLRSGLEVLDHSGSLRNVPNEKGRGLLAKIDSRRAPVSDHEALGHRAYQLVAQCPLHNAH
jgi:hypothetical protein